MSNIKQISLLPGESYSATMTFQHREDGEIEIALDFPQANALIGGYTAGHSFDWLLERFCKLLPSRVAPLFHMPTNTMRQQD